MGITIKTPQEIAQDFLDNLKNLKPNLNTDQTDSDWFVKSRVIGGVVAGVYADLNRVSNDAFPQSARREAIDQHLQVWTGAGLRAASFAQGFIAVSGTPGTTVTAGTQFQHVATQNVYNSTAEVTLTGPTGEIPVTSVIAGQDQNLLTGTSLTVISPPSGLLTTGTALTPGLADGADAETTEQGATRVLAIIRAQRRGATESDYIAWAFAADSRVNSAKINRFPYGLGTVGIVITSGTSDIDTAIDNDDTINLSPSVDLIADVESYIDAVNPLTDTAFVLSPSLVTVTIDVNVRFVAGDQNTLISEAGVTQGHLVEREIMRAIYKNPIGGTAIDTTTNRYLLASLIEEQIDINLSASNGKKYQIIADRQVTDLGGSGVRYALTSTQKAVPGTITMTET